MSEININQSRAIKGRGAVSNASGRFESRQHEVFDDGWDIPLDDSRPKTEVQVDSSRSVLVYNQSPDLPFDRSLNPYRGCEHGCVYCFARPTHA
ncbi:MAG: radical SAM protein, partial [Gammaproteobacteria bacterium]